MSIYKKLKQFKDKEVKLIKDITGFNYKYANLSQIQEKINPILDELKLLVVHKVDNQKVVTTIIDLEDDTSIESGIDIGEVNSKRIEKFIDKNGKNIEIITENSIDPQGVGSIITYYRRYNLLAMLDLETEDDDGKGGSNKAKGKDYESVNWLDNKGFTQLKEGIENGKLKSWKQIEDGLNSKGLSIKKVWKEELKSDIDAKVAM